MDVAASEFLMKDGKYDLNFKNQPNDGSDVKTGCLISDMSAYLRHMQAGLRAGSALLGRDASLSNPACTFIRTMASRTMQLTGLYAVCVVPKESCFQQAESLQLCNLLCVVLGSLFW